MRGWLPRRSLVRLRLSVRGVRRVLQPWRLPIAGAAGAVGAMLGAIYEQIAVHWRISAIVTIGLLTAMTVLLTEPPVGAQAELVDRGARDERSAARAALEPLVRRTGLGRLRRPRLEPRLPESDGLFRGRERELDDLIGQHDAARAARQHSRFGLRGTGTDAGRTTTGPVLLLVHGKPGVGKSALALELGRRLAGQYPHGQVYANLGTLGGARAPGEILKIFLVALGWPEDEMPNDTLERAKIFRSLTTKRRMLFVLDAARNPEQVVHVLPAELRAAVIVTSRRDLGPPLNATSYALGVPDTDEAIAILRAASGTEDGTRPECAAEIVRYGGSLPLALRAAADRVSPGGAELCQVASLLRPERTRLDWLERPGTSVVERIASEYDRLLDQEQRALQLLTLVDSPTFVPWVLAPLLDVGITEAENLVIRLSAAQMLDSAGTDELTGLARYSFHPLIRLYVHAKRMADDGGDDAAARSRLDDAYREVIVSVLTRLDASLVMPSPHQYLPAESDLPAELAAMPEPWVRAEYRNLLRCVRMASRSEPALCWRIGAWLGGCVPDDIGPEETIAAYDLALAAAHKLGDELGHIDVLLAKGSYLVAIEAYGEALATMKEAGERAVRLRLDGGDDADEATRRAVRVHRKIGEAYLQMAAFDRAADEFRAAYERAAALGDVDEQVVARLLLGETYHADSPGAPDPDAIDGPSTDVVRFRMYLAAAEAARRGADWSRAEQQLDRALASNSDDARRVALVQYRLGRLYLDRHVRERGWPDFTATGEHRQKVDVSLADRAVRRAAEATAMFRRMGNEIGVIRGHCLLARALLAAGHLVEAERVGHAADRALAALDRGAAGPAFAPLTARVRRMLGDIALCRGDVINGRGLLLSAATLFAYHHDWAAESEALRRLRNVRWAGDATTPWSTMVEYQRPEELSPRADPGDPLAASRLVDLLVHRYRELMGDTATRTEEAALALQRETKIIVDLLTEGPVRSALAGRREPEVLRTPVGHLLRYPVGESDFVLVDSTDGGHVVSWTGSCDAGAFLQLCRQLSDGEPDAYGIVVIDDDRIAGPARRVITAIGERDVGAGCNFIRFDMPIIDVAFHRMPTPGRDELNIVISAVSAGPFGSELIHVLSRTAHPTVAACVLDVAPVAGQLSTSGGNR